MVVNHYKGESSKSDMLSYAFKTKQSHLLIVKEFGQLSHSSTLRLEIDSQ